MILSRKSDWKRLKMTSVWAKHQGLTMDHVQKIVWAVVNWGWRKWKISICLLGYLRGNSIHDVVPFVGDKVGPEWRVHVLRHIIHQRMRYIRNLQHAISAPRMTTLEIEGWCGRLHHSAHIWLVLEESFFCKLKNHLLRCNQRCWQQQAKVRNLKQWNESLRSKLSSNT